MAGFTKQAIELSFLKLLNERPINKITVKDIVEECGINRNSFYYHFRDIPALAEQIIIEMADQIIEENASIDSIQDCTEVAVSFAKKNQKAMIHLYNSGSGNRELYEQTLTRICGYVAGKYMDAIYPEEKAKEEGVKAIDDRKLLVRFFQCQLAGQILDWMKDGMRADLSAQVGRIAELFHGSIEQAIERSLTEAKGA